MHRSKAFVVASLLCFSSFTVACSGAAPNDFFGTPSVETANETPAEQTTAPPKTDTTPPKTDATPPKTDDATKPPTLPTSPPTTPADPPVAQHCNVSPASPEACAENVQGRAGEIVALEIFLLGNAACTEAWEASGHLLVDFAKFELTNEVEQVDCRTRRVAPGANGDVVFWNYFGGSAIAACPNNVPMGKADTLKIRIRPGTPPGDYVVGWDNAGIAAAAGAPAACGSNGGGIAGVIRVLPPH